MVISIMMQAGVPRPESGGYVWPARSAMGKQILSICSQGFFYVDLILIRNCIVLGE
jgi:hypothetical protein